MSAKTNLVRVVYWNGTTQNEKEVSTYQEAMKIVSSEHRNARGPAFYEIATGRELHDDGSGLRAEGANYYVV